MEPEGNILEVLFQAEANGMDLSLSKSLISYVDPKDGSFHSVSHNSTFSCVTSLTLGDITAMTEHCQCVKKLLFDGMQLAKWLKKLKVLNAAASLPDSLDDTIPIENLAAFCSLDANLPKIFQPYTALDQYYELLLKKSEERSFSRDDVVHALGVTRSSEFMRFCIPSIRLFELSGVKLRRAFKDLHFMDAALEEANVALNKALNENEDNLHLVVTSSKLNTKDPLLSEIFSRFYVKDTGKWKAMILKTSALLAFSNSSINENFTVIEIQEHLTDLQLSTLSTAFAAHSDINTNATKALKDAMQTMLALE